MSTDKKRNAFAVSVRFDGADPDEAPPAVTAYAFDATGRFLEATAIAPEGKKGKAAAQIGSGKLNLRGVQSGQTLRLVIAPENAVPAGDDTPSIGRLLKSGGYERRLRIDTRAPQFEIDVLKPQWEPWFLCSCVVRGRLVKRIAQPDGNTLELPICHARVYVCEVDKLPLIIRVLPDDILHRLRDDLVDIVRGKRPIPPIPDPDPGPIPRPIPQPDPAPFADIAGNLAESQLRPGQQQTLTTAAQPEIATLDRQEIEGLSILGTTSELRRRMIEISDLIWPHLCILHYLDIYFRYVKQCLGPVEVDETGRFSATLFYPCFGDKPDVYVWAEQWIDDAWKTIYKPSVRCHTHWDYHCGEEIVINVTSPCAEPCVPEDPVDPPRGITEWVMPFSVGGTKIWGSPSPAARAPNGWVRTNGMTNYGGLQDAPFGATLGFRQSSSITIPHDGAKFYKWSWRRGNSGAWTPLTTPVTRRYVRQEPGALPSFPAYKLGPVKDNCFEFKPQVVPDSEKDPADPPGTLYHWPTDNFFGDIYSAFWNTVTDVPAFDPASGDPDLSGSYQVRLEVLDKDCVTVVPGPGTFRFIVPTGFAADGVTVESRLAEPSEIIDNGFVFNLHIDNNRCGSLIDAPAIGATAVADVCGFLRYDPDANPLVTVSFSALHRNNHATFGLGMVRGAVAVVAAQVPGGTEVDANPAGAYSGDGNGNFTNDFPIGTLLGNCENAAFSTVLNVHAKATNGISRINAYDASTHRAFALAVQPPPASP